MMDRNGSSLLELIVVLGLLALMTTLVVATFDRGPVTADPTMDVRRRAIHSAAAAVADDSLAGQVLFLPDGRAVGRGFDPLTGARTDGAR
jgi:type II secretory pathway pseudopilin PulG